MPEVQESHAVMPVPQVFSPSERDVEETLDAFLSNRDQLLCLVFLMREYVRQLEAVESLCIRVLNKQVCYLFDFDVIQNYLEMGSVERLETFPVKYLFTESKIPFAIPIGAFEELLSYLSSLSRTSGELCRLDQACSGEQAVRLIAASLDVPNQDELTHDRRTEEIAERLDASILELTRLLEVLQNPRFQGVRTSYDERCCIAWLKVIKACKRPHWKRGMPRSKVDRRDAKNLAVASRRVGSSAERNAGTSSGEEAYNLLISQTNVVFDLLRHAEDKEELRGLSAYFNVNPLLLSDIHPAIHPWDAKRADQLGALNKPVDTTLAHLKAWISNFRATTEHLLNQLIWNTEIGPKEAYKEAVGPFVLQHRKELAFHLQKMKQDVLDPSSEIHRIEEDRATGESEEQARRRQIGERDKPEDELRIRALQFKRLLGQIAGTLDGTIGVEYESEILGGEANSPFARVRIGIRGEKNGHARPVITGELYRHRDYASAFGSFQYFSMRWPITCLEEKLIEGLTRIWRAYDTSDRNVPSTRLVELGDDPKCWRQGLIVRTTGGDLYTPLEAASRDGKWDSLRLRRLGVLVEEAGMKFDAPDGRRLAPTIIQLRVNTLFGDIVYDVKSAPTERSRYLTVLSHYNLGSQLAQLYFVTGSMFCMPAKLADVLSNVLQDFCPIPS